MERVVIYSAYQSERLTYMLDWLFTEQFGIGYIVVDTPEDALPGNFCIHYGSSGDTGISIPANDLLKKTGVDKHEITLGLWNNIPTLYADDNTQYTLPFDIFSAMFFLISRYEEHYSYIPDKHNRYPATESLLYKNGWLRRPLVDEWVEQFRLLLNLNGLSIAPQKFSYQPTYDIDIAWSYKHKGILRNIGAGLKDIATTNFSQLSERVSVLRGNTKDPYDSFGWLSNLHTSLNLRPLYFILSTARATPFDKNIPPTHAAMQQLVRDIAKGAHVAIHPSYYTDKRDNLLISELNALEAITGISIRHSRQHYIRLFLPSTCYQLINANITDDYSMGYGTHLGFRAGTGRSFFWFDLAKNERTNLRIHPFCFMDTTAHYNEQLSVGEAFNVLGQMSEKLEAGNSILTTIFHNFSLGNAREWHGWGDAYAAFLKRMPATS